MNFAHGGQIPYGFNHDLISEDVGYFWAPETEDADAIWTPVVDVGGALASAECAIQNSPYETIAVYQQNSSHSSCAESSYSQEYDTPANNENVEGDDSGRSRAMGRPRFPLQSSRDAVMNRIQRRRIQNRNSQRIYRQRRVDERHKFETRAVEAEKTANELRNHVGELHSMVASLKHQVEQLKAENAALRRCPRCEV